MGRAKLPHHTNAANDLGHSDDDTPMTRIRWRPPLFLRIFTVILAAVVGAQALNFALLLVVRLPEPRVYPIASVAAALASGRAPAGLQVTDTAGPGGGGRDARDMRVGAALAARLGLAPDQVRVHISRPPGLSEAKHGGLPNPFAAGDGHREHGAMAPADPIVGRFVAAGRLPDGSWRTVGPAEQTIEPWQWQALLWLLGSAALVVVVSWFAARRLAAPVDMFGRAAERLGRDPNAAPLTLDGPPEIAAAAQAFNAMQARLQRYVDDRVTMVAAIAHDLRTPLMRLSLLLDQAPPGTRAAAEAEIAAMGSRIGSILAFMKGVHGHAPRQRLDLGSLVESVVAEAADHGTAVTAACPPGVVVEADLAALRALLSNLVDNALRYAGHAHVVLTRGDGEARIRVEDRGPGMPEAELERVFQPFYRIDASRSHDTGGTGLGLASARAIARAHGGDVRLVNRAGGGLAAVCTLPM